jgi:hypothetical protein
MDPQAVKQQIVDRVKQAENILVTVSANPSVDQLASCIGLTLLLNKMGKSATAVFSGKVPSTLEFLQPEQMLSTSPDSLRDFIISLDKAKADKLRYKVEDQVVRIFITPYKTKLTDKDLVFSEGDFNVEVIVTLGVLDRGSLDGAISAHGRILHDATVIALSAGQGKAPDLGQINWQDPSASSLAEMIVSLSEAFGTNLLDNQMATAFLTGIVAETDRFSNKKTSPKVMTMSAQLMAAGANQQLVISKLTPPAPVAPKQQPAPPPPPKPKEMPEKPKPAPPPPPPKPKEEPPKPKKPEEEKPKEIDNSEPTAGVLNVGHDGDVGDSGEVEINTSEIHIDTQGNIKLIEDGPKTPEKEKGDDDSAKKDKPKENLKPKRPPEPPPVAEVHIVNPPPNEKHEEPAPPPPPPPPPEQKPPEVLPPPPLPKMEPAPPPPPPPNPAPPVPDILDGLPPLPPPEPLPSIRLENSAASPHISTPSLPSSPLPPPPGPAAGASSSHAVLDPLRQPPRMGASFSADTNDSWGGGSNLNVDPVNNVPLNPQGGESYSQAKQVSTPAPHASPLDQVLGGQGQPQVPTGMPPGELTPESARQAVENAFNAVPFDPAHNPQVAQGSTPMGPVLHQPPAYDNTTPSLNLPTAAPGAPVPPPLSPPPSNVPPPAPAPPPPGPPPFMPPPTL